MNKISSILAIFIICLLFVSIILNIVFIPKTSRKPGTITLTEYVNTTDTVFKIIEKQVFIEKPTIVYRDTGSVVVYRDTIHTQHVDIEFTNRVQGELLSSKLDYKLKTFEYKPIFKQAQQGHNQKDRLYLVGKLQVSTEINPGIGAIYIPGKPRFMAGYVYGLNHKTHNLLIGYKF